MKRTILFMLCLLMMAAHVSFAAIATKSSTTLTVCAYDAKDVTLCDYQATGLNDHLTIQLAVDALESAGKGGKIWLSEGNFYLGGTIVIHQGNIWIDGAGLNSTYLKSAVGSAFDYFNFTNNITTQYGTKMSNFTAYGYNNVGAFLNNHTGSAEFWDMIFEDIYVDGFQSAVSPVFDLLPAWGKRFNRVIIEQSWGGASAIRVQAGSSSNGLMITNSKIMDNLGPAIELVGVTNASISGNELGAGMRQSPQPGNPSVYTVVLTGASFNGIICNKIISPAQGISLDGSSSANIINGNTFGGTSAVAYGINIASGAQLTNISNNIFVVYGKKEINDAGIGTIKFGNSSAIGMDAKNNMVTNLTSFSNNVGIGTAIPSASLDVNGAIRSSKAISGKVTCWKADKTIGSCSGSVVVTTGACTCI